MSLTYSLCGKLNYFRSLGVDANRLALAKSGKELQYKDI